LGFPSSKQHCQNKDQGRENDLDMYTIKKILSSEYTLKLGDCLFHMCNWWWITSQYKYNITDHAVSQSEK